MTPTRTAPSPTTLGQGLLALVAACALVLLGNAPAQAHAQLVRSSPSSGATLSAAPPEVMLKFNEDINPQFATVTVTKGSSRASTGSPEVSGPSVYQPIDPQMAAGTWTVAYKVTSSDGHPVSGSYRFTYEPAGAGEGDPDATSPTSGSETSGTATTSAPPSSSDTSSGTSSSATSSSGTPEPSSSSDPTTSTSSSTSATSEPTSTSTTTSATATPADDEPTSDGDADGLPWWVWLLLALAGAALVGGILAWQRARRQDDVDLRQHFEEPYDEPYDERYDGRGDGRR